MYIYVAVVLELYNLILIQWLLDCSQVHCLVSVLTYINGGDGRRRGGGDGGRRGGGGRGEVHVHVPHRNTCGHIQQTAAQQYPTCSHTVHQTGPHSVYLCPTFPSLFHFTYLSLMVCLEAATVSPPLLWASGSHSTTLPLDSPSVLRPSDWSTVGTEEGSCP